MYVRQLAQHENPGHNCILQNKYIVGTYIEIDPIIHFLTQPHATTDSIINLCVCLDIWKYLSGEISVA